MSDFARRDCRRCVDLTAQEHGGIVVEVCIAIGVLFIFLPFLLGCL